MPATAKTTNLFRQFRTVYADVVAPCPTDETWENVAQVRQLQWRAENPVALRDAVCCYAMLFDGYNAFQPWMLAHLLAEFGDTVQVTPAREYSVAVYLHVADRPALRRRLERFVRRHFIPDEVSWVDDNTLRVWWD